MEKWDFKNITILKTDELDIKKTAEQIMSEINS